MSRLVDSVYVRPDELKSGDVLVAVVTLHVMQRGDDFVFRMYRCSHPPQEHEGIPQGSRIADEKELAQQLFPVVGWAEIEPDLL